MTRWFLKFSAWLALALCLAATIVPVGFRPQIAIPPDADRILAFSVLGFLFALAYPSKRKLVALVLVASAFAIEALQFLQPSRHPRIDDAAIKAVGALLGVALAWLLARLRKTASHP